MSELRDLIRSILREEIAALRLDAGAPAPEVVRVDTDRDLADFVKDIAERCEDASFRRALATGAHRFSLATPQAVGAAPMRFAQTEAAPKPAAAGDNEVFGRGLITEKDIAGMDHSRKTLRIGKGARLTPLAQDEARRLGIRIERAQR
jgi:hypothetical protein